MVSKSIYGPNFKLKLKRNHIALQFHVIGTWYQFYDNILPSTHKMKRVAGVGDNGDGSLKF